MAEEELSAVLQGNNAFSKRLCEILPTIDGDVFLSPINIYSILTLMSQDPWFYNKRVFNNVLHIPDVNVAAERYKDILAFLDVSNDVSVASQAFLKDDLELQELFRTRLTNKFVYEINLINFNRSEYTANIINNWTEVKTFRRIKMDPDTLDSASRLTLLNTIHFSGKWAQPFNTDNTITAPFFVNNNDIIEVQMMTMRSEFYYNYDDSSGAKILELPFVNDDISLVIVLPNINPNFDYYDLTELTEDMVKQEVDVSLPKFTIEESIELKQHLCKLGLTDAFTANLFEVVKGEEVNLSKVQQKAFISVNEEGSEMAAGMMSNLDALCDEDLPKDGIIINEMNMNTDISNRYAKTEVVWKLRNVKQHSNMVNFKVVLTETSFITGFVMEIEETSYRSYIEKKEVAKNIYNAALARGQSAGLVEAATRDSKEFTVSVNIEPETAAVFTLTYEEMLVRVHDQYELVLNICPGQIVQNINVEVHITESRPLRFVKTPPLRSGNDIGTTNNESFLDPCSEIQMKNSKTAIIKFRPNIRDQKKFAHYLDTNVSNGLSGQFVLQYDVQRDPHDGEVLLQDGYFVHFLAPNDLDPLPKHVVFVLDTSGSMGGRKIVQLKDAMTSILSDIKKSDMISIIEFNAEVKVWDINTATYTVVPYNQRIDFLKPFRHLNQIYLPHPANATETVISNAKTVVEKLLANSNTFIIGALQTALYVVKMGQHQSAGKSEKCQPIIVFLTDGEPNVGLSSTEQIVQIVTLNNNRDIKVPIFSLSFGDGADKNFLRKLSLKNQGFSRHIYEASDASLQLQEFYKQISSPLLSDIKFKYESEVEDVTRTHFPIYFRGSELVVCGRYGLPFSTLIHCCGPTGPVFIRSTTETPTTSLERLWAYLTIKQLLEQRDFAENKTELTQKAVALALEYSFVTDVTSLVVVKPTEINTVHTDANEYDMSDIMSCSGVVDYGLPVPLACTRPRRVFGGGGPMCQQAQVGSYSHLRNRTLVSAGRDYPMLMCDIQATSSCYPRFHRGELSVSRSEETTFLYHSDAIGGNGGGYSEDVDDTSERNPLNFKKKKTEEFLADRPFHIFLRYKKNNEVIILFQGRVCEPR